MHPGQNGGAYNANGSRRQMAYHSNRPDGRNGRNMHNPNSTYFARDVMSDTYGVADDSNCLSTLHSGVRDDSDMLFPVYLNSEHKQYLALRDSGCFTSLIVDESLVPKKSIRHDQTVMCQGLFEGGRKHRLPTAEVLISSPRFGSKEVVATTAIVAKLPRDVPIIIGNKFFQLHKQLCDVIVVRKRGVEDGLNTESGKNPESANLAGTQSKRRDAKFRRETGDSGSATDAERDTHTRSQTPTGKAEGHQMHLPRVNEIAAEGKFRGNLSRKHTDADNARDGADARTDELMTASHDRKAQRDGTATYAHQTGERGDGQRVDNDINGTVSSRRRVTRNDIDKSTARDRQAESLINTTCQVVTRNATRAGARTDEVSKHDHRQRRGRADRQSEERRIQDAIGKDDLDNTFKELSEIDMTDLEAVRKQKEHIATEFSKQQRSDPSLQIGWTRAERGSNEYKVIHGLLYKRTKFETDTVDDFALVVPQEHRKDLLIISHDTVSA